MIKTLAVLALLAVSVTLAVADGGAPPPPKCIIYSPANPNCPKK